MSLPRYARRELPAAASRALAVVVLSILMAAPAAAAAAPALGPAPETVQWMRKALDTWAALCSRHLRLDVEPPPWTIFYDEQQAWHLNPEVVLLPAHKAADVTFTAAGQSRALVWVAHDKGVWVPTGAPVPVGPGHPPHTYAITYGDGRKVVVIFALPWLVQRALGSDPFPYLEEFFIGVAAHELAHTHQHVDVTRRIRALRKYHVVPEGIDDNYIEQTYGPDPAFKRLHDDERDRLLRAALADDDKSSRRLLDEGLTIAEQQRKQFFTGDKAVHAELEDIFLVMEGIGMWMQYQAMRQLMPEEPRQNVVTSLLSGGGAWSQEEGLALVFLLDRFVPDWQSRFLAPDFPSALVVLRTALAKRSVVTGP